MSRRDLMGDDDEAPAVNEKAEIDIRTNLRGVNITWLSQIFRMDQNTCKRKLSHCPEVGKGKGGAPLFDVAQAAGYLVKPKVNISEWVKSLRPADLPPYLQSEFWEAQRKRQQYEENAGDLWRTDRVVELYAETFKLIKETMNLWVDSIERKSGVTGEQRAILMQLADGLQDELHKRLTDLKKESSTRNTAAELEDIEAHAAENEDKKFTKRYTDV